MKKMVLGFGGALLLGGCLTQAGFNRDLQSLVGDPVSVAVSALGYPDGERTIAGAHLYVWSSDHQALLPVATSSFGQVGGVGYSQTNYGLMAARAHCTIQLQVDANDIIRSWQWSGNRIGCRNYAERLR